MKLNDLSGQRFGMLTVLTRNMNTQSVSWRCLCDCGNISTVSPCHLKSGHTKSCGCLKIKGGHRFLDLTGKKFNMLTVVSLYSCDKSAIWNCICDCSNKTKVRAYNLKNGAVKSCGCLQKTNPAVTTHGMKHTRLYETWDNMKGRCYRPSMECFKNYGGKGITVCDEWLSDFINFHDWAIANGYTDTMTIERKNNSKGYCPDNCTFIPQGEQSRNRDCALGVDKVSYIKGKLKDGVSCNDLAKEFNTHPSTISKIKTGKAYPYVPIP
jgi:hypothetical protein